MDAIKAQLLAEVDTLSVMPDALGKALAKKLTPSELILLAEFVKTVIDNNRCNLDHGDTMEPMIRLFRD